MGRKNVNAGQKHSKAREPRQRSEAREPRLRAVVKARRKVRADDLTPVRTP